MNSQISLARRLSFLSINPSEAQNHDENASSRLSASRSSFNVSEPKSEVLASIAECPGCVDGAGKIWARYDAYVTCPCYSCGSKLFRRPIDGINQYDNYYPCLKFFNKERTISGCEIRRNQAATRITRTRAGSNEKKSRFCMSAPGHDISPSTRNSKASLL